MARCSGVLGVWAVVWKPGARSSETGAGALPAQALPPAAGRAIPARVASWASPWVWHWWRACRQPVGPHGLMCAPRSGTRGRGKRLGRRLDGRRAARRPCHPQKNFRRAAPGAGLGRFHCHGRGTAVEQAAIEPNVHWPDVKWTGRFGLIANVRGGDGVAALATGHVAPDNGRQESPTAAAVGLPPSRSPRRRSGAVDGNRATAAPARDSTNPASIHRLRFVMDEGPPVPGPSPLAGRSL